MDLFPEFMEDLAAEEDIWAAGDTWEEHLTTEAGRTGAGEVTDPGLEDVEEAALTWEREDTRDGEVLEVGELVEGREAGEELHLHPTSSLSSKLGEEADLVIQGSQVKRRSSSPRL